MRASGGAGATAASRIGLIGEPVDLTYPGRLPRRRPGSRWRRSRPARATSPRRSAAAKRPLVIVGQGALARPDGDAVLSLAAKLATGGEREEGWNGLAVLHTAAARVGGLDLGFVPGDGGHDVIGMIAAAAAKEIDVLFLLGADEIRSMPWATPSSSISAPTAMPARTAPT